MTKRLIWLSVLALVAVGLVAFGIGTAYAQDVPANPDAPYGMGPGGRGVMRTYVKQVVAEKLGLTEEELAAQLAESASFQQVLLDAGIAEADIPAWMEDVHQEALALAVADGVLTQEQADAMFERMQERGFGNFGNCDMDGDGFGGRRGGRGGRGPGFGPGDGAGQQP